MKQKDLILTIDYEVFLGAETGDIRRVLINPTYELMDILKLNGSKMTVFWDVLHYYSICKWSELYPELIEEKELVGKQIKDLVAQGHDIQMHLHPHWIDAKYVDGKWVFDYSRFSLHKLSHSNNESDINTIRGCVMQMKDLIESVITPYKPDYKVSAFRAGGYLIEPFEDLVEAFKAAGITIDSSVCPSLSKPTTIYPYNFKGYPNYIAYRFNSTPKKRDDQGAFWEKPIFTVRLSALYRLKRIMLGKRKNNSYRTGYGKGVVFPVAKQSGLQKIWNHFQSNHIQLTMDGADAMQLSYSMRKVKQGAVMILHPKMQTENSFNLLKQYISNGIVKFHSIEY